MKVFILSILLSGLPSVVLARMAGTNGAAPSSPLDASVLGDTSTLSAQSPTATPSILNRFSGLLGGDFRSTGGASQLMLALGVRYYIGQIPSYPPLQKGGWGDLSVEVGGSLSDVPSGFHQSTLNYGGVSYQAQVESMSEEHIAAVWQFCKTRYFIPEFMLGVSVARFHDEETEGQAPFTPVDKTEIGISQITQLGGTFPLNSHAGLNIGIGYERYSNHFLGDNNTGFDLTVSALTIRAMLEVRL